jgi:hypothetical protein
MTKRRSVESFIADRNRLVKEGKVYDYERLLDKFGVTGEQKVELMEQFKRDAEAVLRSSGHFPK